MNRILPKLNYNQNMQAHFEYPSGLTQMDIKDFLADKGIQGKWTDWELNVFAFHSTTTSKQMDFMFDICKTGFVVKGIPVRGYMIPPPPPKLQRCDNVI